MYIISGAVAALSPSWLRSHCCDLIMTSSFKLDPLCTVSCGTAVSLQFYNLNHFPNRGKPLCKIQMDIFHNYSVPVSLATTAHIFGSDCKIAWNQWWWWRWRLTMAMMMMICLSFFCPSVPLVVRTCVALLSTWHGYCKWVSYVARLNSLFIVTSHKLLVADWQRWCASRHTYTCTCTC